MGAILPLSTAALDEYVGASIEEICVVGYGKVGDDENHCAHFVGHALSLHSGLGIGRTCNQMTFAGKSQGASGACIRVDEIYNFCDDLEAPAETGCLAYYTLSGNMHRDGTMGQMRKKHIGIYFQGLVWNYGNTKDQVRCDAVAGLKRLYGKNTITRFTEFPSGAKFKTFTEIAFGQLAGK